MVSNTFFSEKVLFLHLLGTSYIFVRCRGKESPGPLRCEQPVGYDEHLYCEENEDYKNFLEWKKEAAKNDPRLLKRIQKFFDKLRTEDLHNPCGVDKDRHKKFMNCIRCYKLDFGELICILKVIVFCFCAQH